MSYLATVGNHQLKHRRYNISNLSAVLHGVGDLRIEECAVPEPASHEALVKVGAVGICGSDVHYYVNGRIGELVALEPGVPEPGVPDCTCKECLAGRYNLCRNVVFFATPPVDGSIAQFVAIDASFAHRAPDGATPERWNWFT